MLSILGVSEAQPHYVKHAPLSIKQTEFIQQPIQLLGAQNHNLAVELAVSAQQRGQGLMFRSKLETGTGMLFIFDYSQQVNMWMKNTYIPLDIVFYDRNRKLVSIARNTIPHSLSVVSSGNRALYALELEAGMVYQLGLKVGDSFRFIKDE